LDAAVAAADATASVVVMVIVTSLRDTTNAKVPSAIPRLQADHNLAWLIEQAEKKLERLTRYQARKKSLVTVDQEYRRSHSSITCCRKIYTAV